MKNIYLVISQTGSILSRIIKRVTGDKYSHASIALQEDLSCMYSFGRIFKNFPIIGGFVKESPYYGAMQKFSDADIAVVELTVPDDKYQEINDYILNMYAHRKKYHYNFLGVLFAKRGVHLKRKNYFYCSEFIRHLLEQFGIVKNDDFTNIVRPAEFLNVRGGKIIYTGKLCEYAK